MKKWPLLVLAFLSCTLSYGQSGLYYLPKEYEEDPYDQLTYFYTGANFLSNSVYMGRKDSLALPYLSPFVGYQMANGLYAKAMASYAPNGKNGRFDLLTLELGYDRTFGKHLLTGISAEKYFYYKKSPGIKAAIQQNITLYALYKNRLLEPQIIFCSNQNKTSSDMMLGLSVDHNFRFLENTLNVIPTITYYAGSQNYFNDYYLNMAQRMDKTFPKREMVALAGESKPLVFEFCVKTTYRTGNWLFTLIPTYLAPVSASTIRLPNNKSVTEQLKASTFISLEACYRYERK